MTQGRAAHPQISVIIPTYNRWPFLPRAIESALQQTLPVKEVIVADDGSNDGTVERLNESYGADSRVRLLSLDHGGANRARNAAAAVAQGNWFAFLDSDDWWAPEKLANQMAALIAMPTAVAAFTGMEIHGHGVRRSFIPKSSPSLFDLRCSNTLSSTSTALVSREIFQLVDGFDPELTSCQDWDLWFRLREVGPFALVRELLTFLDAGEHSRITNNIAAISEGHEQVFRRFRAGVPEGPGLRRIDACHDLVRAEKSCRSEAYGEALKMSLSSLLSGHYSNWGLRIAARSVRGLMKI